MDIPLKSFWVLHITTVNDVRYCWAVGTMRLTMREALEALSGQRLEALNLDQRSDERWVAINPSNSFGEKSVFYVYNQEDMPKIPDKLRTGVYDHRKRDMDQFIRENSMPPRPGFKVLPASIKL